MLTVPQIAWAAGIYEGEGTFSGGKSVRVIQKDNWLIYKLKELFGGTVGMERGYYTWTICGQGARGFLLTIFSYLSPRRREQIKKYSRFFKDENFNNHKNICDYGHELTPRNLKWEYSSTHAWKSCRLCIKRRSDKKRLAKSMGITFAQLTVLENSRL